MIIDDDGLPHISYYGFSQTESYSFDYCIDYVYCTEISGCHDLSGWEYEDSIVDSAISIGLSRLFTGLFLLDQTPFVSYLIPNGSGTNVKLRYIDDESDDWIDSTPPISFSGLPVSSVDSARPSFATFNDIAGVAYFNPVENTLHYAHFDGVNWSTPVNIEPINSGAGFYPSIVFDLAGNPNISYFDSVNKDLKYAYFNGLVWEIETVESESNVGLFTSIDVDSNNKPHIAYSAYTLNEEIQIFSLRYAHK
jgi:hypothetical protein